MMQRPLILEKETKKKRNCMLKKSACTTWYVPNGSGPLKWGTIQSQRLRHLIQGTQKTKTKNRDSKKKQSHYSVAEGGSKVPNLRR